MADVSDKVHQTALVLANAGELASLVIKKIAGNDISTAVSGSPLTREMIQNLVTRSIANSVAASSPQA